MTINAVLKRHFKIELQIIFILIVSILALFLNGYYFNVSDQYLYIPSIQKIVDPSLYKNDILFEQPSSRYTLLFYPIAYLALIFSLEWIFFVGYLIATFILFYSVFKLSIVLFDRRSIAYIAVLLCFIYKPIAGTSSTTHELFFTLRSFTMPITLLAMGFFIDERYIAATLTSAIAFQIHPLTAIAPTMVIIGYIAFNLVFSSEFRSRIGIHNGIKSIVVFVIAMLPLLLKVLFSESENFGNLSPFSLMPEDWLNIVKLRNRYAFPSIWNIEVWKYVIFYSILFVSGFCVAFFKTKEYNKHIRSVWLAVTSLLSILICYVFSDLFPLPLIVQCQIGRGFFMIIYLALIYAAYLIGSEYLSENSSIISKFIVVLCGVSFASGKLNLLILGVIAYILIVLPRNFWKYSEFIGAPLFGILLFYFEISGQNMLSNRNLLKIPALILVVALLVQKFFWRDLLRKYIPILAIIVSLVMIRLPVVKILFKGKINQRTDIPLYEKRTNWIQVQKWASNNTEKDAMFLVPPKTSGFRSYSKRSIVGDWKDGAPGIFSRRYALKWYARMQSLGNYPKFQEEDFLKAAKKYEADFVVTRKGHKLDFEKVYENSGFLVYRIP